MPPWQMGADPWWVFGRLELKEERHVMWSSDNVVISEQESECQITGSPQD